MILTEFQHFITDPKTPVRFIPSDLTISNWEDIERFFEKLQNRNLDGKESLWQWLLDRSELGAVLEEDLAWRYIRMTCNTQDKEAAEQYSHFIETIEPQASIRSNLLDVKMVECPAISDLDFPGSALYIKHIRKDIEIFRKENVPLQTEVQTRSQRYATLIGAMNIDWEGQSLPLPKAAVFLQSVNREERKRAYEAIQNRRMADADELQLLFSELVQLRHQIGKNAGFETFRDYMFRSLGRFDYTVADCLEFHKAVEKTIVPLLETEQIRRKENMRLDSLRPYDLAVEERGRPPLKAFENGEDLLEKGIEVFTRLDPFFGDCLKAMKQKGHFDLESRNGKAPGGYNYPLDQTGFPFIFMNATSTLRDMVTLMHEGGHAVHSIVTRFLPLSFFKHTSSEVAELASMSMELLSMDHWNVFFENPDDLKRAKKEHLSQVIDTLPWVATIDAFQHWIYENPDHSVEDRTSMWLEISSRFSSSQLDYTGYEKFREIGWHKQLHLFEVPFYYIEYGMAQLGAISVWKAYKSNPEKAIQSYVKALSLGHTVGIKEMYQTAGIQFDFSEEYIRELMNFVQEEIEKLA
ncbi:MAG TPA: M3 family oligoendopeptidase [Catalimonadaceae bacterium]|nr:M3 family oligoendopeptidase [Catalimonadaceae bacterium]